MTFQRTCHLYRTFLYVAKKKARRARNSDFDHGGHICFTRLFGHWKLDPARGFSFDWWPKPSDPNLFFPLHQKNILVDHGGSAVRLQWKMSWVHCAFLMGPSRQPSKHYPEFVQWSTGSRRLTTALPTRGAESAMLLRVIEQSAVRHQKLHYLGWYKIHRFLSTSMF